MSSEVEQIIRPIVEGQLKGFVKEHPGILDSVIWYKPQQDKMRVFVNSVAKRIIRDLVSDENIERLRAALLENNAGSAEISDRGRPSSVTSSRAGSLSGPAAFPLKEKT